MRRGPRRSAANSAPTRSTSSESPASGRGFSTGRFDQRAALQLRLAASPIPPEVRTFHRHKLRRQLSSRPTCHPPTTAKKVPAQEQCADEPDRAELDEQLARGAVGDAADGQERAQAIAENTNAAAQEAEVLVSRLRAKLDKADIEASRLEQEHHRARTALEIANATGQVVARRLGEAVQRREGLCP